MIKGNFLIPIGIVEPDLDNETSLLTFGTSGNIILNYKYDCLNDVFTFVKYGE